MIQQQLSEEGQVDHEKGYVTPLSWKLSKYQQEVLDKAWDQVEAGRQVAGAPFVLNLFLKDPPETEGIALLTLDDVFQRIDTR